MQHVQDAVGAALSYAAGFWAWLADPATMQAIGAAVLIMRFVMDGTRFVSWLRERAGGDNGKE